MFIWKYLDVDPAEVKRIQESFMKAIPMNFNFFQTVKIDTDEFMGMKIKIPVLIQVSPLKVGQIHRDWREDQNVLAIQIPLMNCDNSVTEFWETEHKQEDVRFLENGPQYQYIPKESCKKIDEFRLTQPVIFRTDIPHCVTNPTRNSRKAISLRFYVDPWHLIKDLT